MKNKLKPVFTVLSCMLLFQFAGGQDQSDMTDFLRKMFVNYCKSVPREEIYIQTDRDDYIAGEEMWFSSFLFDRKENLLLPGNSIVYFEILNQENRPVVQKRIRIAGGIGSGQAILPDSLRTGVYLIRAYTNYMRNFLPYNCFMKEIRVLNALNPTVINTPRPTEAISGLSATGKPDGKSSRFSVSGISLTTDGKKPDVLELNIAADNSYRLNNGNICYLFIQTRGNINHVSKEKLSGENNIIRVPKSLLSAGVNQITIFDSKGRPAAESYSFTPPEKTATVKIISGDSFNVRSRIDLEIDSAGEVGKLKNGSVFSVSVAPVKNVVNSAGIIDYLVFASEFGIYSSNIQNDLISAGGYQLPEGIRSNWTDWTKIVSGDLPVLKYKRETNSHYLTGKLISKDSQLPDSGKYVFMSVPGKSAVFQYAKTDRDGNFTFTILNDERVNDLIFQPADAGKSSTVKIESSFSDNYPLTIGDPVAASADSTKSLFSKLSVNYQVSRIYGLTSLGTQKIPEITPVKRLRFYGKPDVEVAMADYIKLPVMQEVFFELLPGTTLKAKRSLYEITIADPVTNRTFDDPPGLLIDGVIINDPALIANIDPEIVERIDVVRERYYVGDYMFYGLINLITRAADFSCVQLPGYAVRIPYRVAEPGWTFTAPDYSTEEKKSTRIPDFRNTLYWNSSVKPDSNGKARIQFWSSDQASEYIINLQGIGADGKFVSVEKIISVKK